VPFPLSTGTSVPGFPAPPFDVDSGTLSRLEFSRSFIQISSEIQMIGPHCCITSSTTALLPLSTLMTLCTGAYPVRVMSIT
jgi:hypothetical protein